MEKTAEAVHSEQAPVQVTLSPETVSALGIVHENARFNTKEVLESGARAAHAAMILNGAAAVAVLTRIGTTTTTGAEPFPFRWPTFLFALGALMATAALGARHFVVVASVSGSAWPLRSVSAAAWNRVAVRLVFVAYITFAVAAAVVAFTA